MHLYIIVNEFPVSVTQNMATFVSVNSHEYFLAGGSGRGVA